MSSVLYEDCPAGMFFEEPRASPYLERGCGRLDGLNFGMTSNQ